MNNRYNILCKNLFYEKLFYFTKKERSLTKDMLIEAAKNALWIFVELICEFTAIYCGAFIGSLIIKKDINWMEQMVMTQYISLAFLGLTTFYILKCLCLILNISC